MKQFFLIGMLLLFPSILFASTHSITVSKVSSNLYQENFGADRYIKTTSCSENADNDTATLTMNGTTGSIEFSSNTVCSVSGAYANLDFSDGTYSTQVSYDTDNWYRVDNVPAYRIKTDSCIITDNAQSATLVISNNSQIHFEEQSCSVEGVFGLETFTSENIGNVALYYPHVETSGGWDTEVCLINTNDTEILSGSLKAYNDNGALVSTSIPISLAPHARREITVGSEFQNSDDIGYIIFESDDSHAIGYTKFYISGTYRVAVPAVADINSDKIYVSHVASSTDWWTGLSLVNTTNAEKILTITFDNGATHFKTIPAYGHEAFLVQSLFENVSQPDINSAVISNASGMVGLELFGSWGDGSMLSGVLLKDETTSSLYYPHIASDETWWTGIVAYNPEISDTKLTITPYSATGSSLQSQIKTLNGKEKYIGLTSSLNFPAETAWFKIDAQDATSMADKPITGFELFGTWNNQQLAGYTGVNINSTEGVFPKLEQFGWTGIAFVNITDQNATVTLTAFDDQGNSIATDTITVNSHAKKVDIASNLFPGQDINDATYIMFSSNQEVVGFQLNGSDDNMLLDGLPSM